MVLRPWIDSANDVGGIKRWRGIIRGRPPVAQWIRATALGSVGRGFESLRAGQDFAHDEALWIVQRASRFGLVPRPYARSQDVDQLLADAQDFTAARLITA